MNKTLKSAIHKCSHFGGEVWYGYLRPQEILELRDLGVLFNSNSGITKIAIERKQEGCCNPLWAYFTPTDGFLEVKKNVHDIKD